VRRFAGSPATRSEHRDGVALGLTTLISMLARPTLTGDPLVVSWR